VSAIDATDNGQEICQMNFEIESFNLTDLIKMFVPKKRTDKKMQKAFWKSVRLVQFILKRKIKKEEKIEKDILKLREIYETAKDKRFLIIEDEKVNTNLITELFPDVLFALKKQSDDVWYLQTIRVKKGEFLRRKYLPDD
jgi:uncharacterized UPF0160 family protein